MIEELSGLIKSREATVGIVGLGYVGIPLAHTFLQAGFTVRGFDLSQKKVDALQRGDAYLEHLDPEIFSELALDRSFLATTEMERLQECAVVLVAVPTPLGPHQEPDLSYVEAAAQQIGASLRPGQLVVLESTTYPGTTREIFLPALVSAASGALEAGRDYLVAYSPEREDPGRDVRSAAVPKLVGGLDHESGQLASEVYSSAFDQVVQVENAEVAESAKLLENIFRAVNIALVNEIKPVLTAMDIDIWKVIAAASTKPFGFMPFYPGPGLGGHCIPIDPFYLSWRAKEFDAQLQFVELSGLVNRAMPGYVVERLSLALNDRGKAVSSSRVLILGLAYKAGVSDTRESPAYRLIELIRSREGEVAYHDSLVPATADLGLTSVALTPESLGSFDAVVISTAQVDIDWQLVADHSQLIVDTRNAMASFEQDLGDRLVKA